MKKRLRRFWKIILIWILLNVAAIVGYLIWYGNRQDDILKEEQIQMNAIKGENREITGKKYDPELAVVCDNGTFVGQQKNEVLSFRGIPYAKPPVGDLRWKRPVDAEPSDGVYEAYYYGKSPIQTDAETERASLYVQGEDCLTLNVWSSADMDASDDGPRAVMVFFPGGGYGWGGTADPIYDGQNFVQAHRDIVLVTANYRIGMMGFADFSGVKGGEAYEGSGNLGLLDQVSALRWVRRNIAGFGGDPGNVTIFGESAGGSSVSLLPLMDEAKGLFRRVIAQSGSVAFTYSKEECSYFTDMLLKEAKASSMKDLAALSEQDLMKLNEKLNDYNNFPERDGVILPEDLYGAYESGGAAGIDMLSGTNADEARYWIGEVGGYPVYRLVARLLYGSLRERFREEDRNYADAFLALQQEGTPWNTTEFFNDLLFRGPAIRQAQAHAESGGTHYMYYWTKPSTIPNYGACHAVELSYVFNNTQDTIFTGDPADPKLAQTVQQMWVNFAKTGNPSVDGHAWKPYERVDRWTMELGDDIVLTSDPLEEQRVLIEPLLEYRMNGYYRMFDFVLIYTRNRLIHYLLIILGVNAAAALFILIRKKLK